MCEEQLRGLYKSIVPNAGLSDSPCGGMPQAAELRAVNSNPHPTGWGLIGSAQIKSPIPGGVARIGSAAIRAPSRKGGVAFRTYQVVGCSLAKAIKMVASPRNEPSGSS